MVEPRSYPTERGCLSSRRLHQTDNKRSASPPMITRGIYSLRSTGVG
jgi:hypothetical protein